MDEDSRTFFRTGAERLDVLLEQRIQEYLLEQTDGVEVEIVRDLHPRTPTVVVLKFQLEGQEQVRYADFDAGPGKPFPHLTAEDPHPLDA